MNSFLLNYFFILICDLIKISEVKWIFTLIQIYNLDRIYWFLIPLYLYCLSIHIRIFFIQMTIQKNRIFHRWYYFFYYILGFIVFFSLLYCLFTIQIYFDRIFFFLPIFFLLLKHSDKWVYKYCIIDITYQICKKKKLKYSIIYTYNCLNLNIWSLD